MGLLGEVVGTGVNIAKGVGEAINNVINFGSAQKQMDFQREMSNTAYQRGTADMIKAGLNPALMYGSAGPASTPQGAMAVSKNPVEGLPELYRDLSKVISEVNLNNATTEKVKAEAGLIDAQIITQDTNASLNSALTKKAVQDAALSSEQKRKVLEEIDEIDARRRLVNAQQRKVTAETPKHEFFGGLYKKGTSIIENLENGMTEIIRRSKEGPNLKYRGGASGQF